MCEKCGCDPCECKKPCECCEQDKKGICKACNKEYKYCECLDKFCKACNKHKDECSC